MAHYQSLRGQQQAFPSLPGALQKRPGEYNVDVLEALDFVMDTARELGMKVMLSFADNWKFLGQSLCNETFLSPFCMSWRVLEALPT